MSWPLAQLVRARRAVAVVDVVESVRLMQLDEGGFIDVWRRFVNDVRSSLLPPVGGRIVKSLGDGMLLEFERVCDATSTAFAIHDAMDRSGVATAPRLALRVGIHVADVAVDADDLYGAGVNLAARVAALAPPGGVVVTADALDELVPNLDAEVDDLGECYFKHIDEPVRCFRLSATTGGPRDAIAPPGPWCGLAVIPFDVASGNLPAAAGQVLAEELIRLLSRSDALGVISRLSSSALAGRMLMPAQAGSLLGVNYCVTGSLRGGSERASAEFTLHEAATNRVIWSSSFSAPCEALVRGDGDVLREVADGVAQTIARIEVARTVFLPMPNLDNYSLMVGGVTLMHRTGRSDFARAREVLEHLVERAGRQPLPRAWLAKWHVLNVQQGWSAAPQADAEAAVHLTARALDADPDCALAHTIAGFACANVLRKFDEAERCYANALRLNPSDSLAWLLTGMLSAFQGDGAAAEGQCQRAQQLSPLDPLRYFYLALSSSAALSAGHYERAVELAGASLRLNRDHLSTHRALTASLELAGRHEEARAAAGELLARDPALTVAEYLKRTPGRDFPVGQRIARALQDAGVPSR